MQALAANATAADAPRRSLSPDATSRTPLLPGRLTPCTRDLSGCAHPSAARCYHVKALFASCPASLMSQHELFTLTLKTGKDTPNIDRNTLNTLFRPRIISSCHDVRDTLMSLFSALAALRILAMPRRGLHPAVLFLQEQIKGIIILLMSALHA